MGRGAVVDPSGGDLLGEVVSRSIFMNHWTNSPFHSPRIICLVRVPKFKKVKSSAILLLLQYLPLANDIQTLIFHRWYDEQSGESFTINYTRTPVNIFINHLDARFNESSIEITFYDRIDEFSLLPDYFIFAGNLQQQYSHFRSFPTWVIDKRQIRAGDRGEPEGNKRIANSDENLWAMHPSRNSFSFLENPSADPSIDQKNQTEPRTITERKIC